jgi:pyruvate, water dikinase
MEKKEASGKYIKWLYELNKSSGQLVGGKGANLAEMFNNKFPVPPAFVITTDAYKYFVKEIREQIDEILESIDVNKTEQLTERAKKIRELIISHKLPEDLKEEILEAYEDLGVDKKTLEVAKTDALNILQHGRDPVFVAVRSSATTEDLDDSSFAGQQETYLDIKGKENLLEKVKKVFASLFTARAIYYRKKRGFSKEKFALAVIVQKMIDSDKSGVIFSKNPVKQNDNIIIESVYGLGEGIVSGKIKPDSYEVSRDLEILEKKVADKKIALTRNSQGEVEQINLKPEISKSQVLEESEINSLTHLAIKIEDHYQKPQDIEFAIESGEIYIVQSRPITTSFVASEKNIEGEPILSGLGASPGISSGKVKIIHDLDELNKIQKGDILVTKMTNPDMVVSMQVASAIITDEGGLTSHAAIVSREMGTPAVVGTDNATEILKDGQIVTVDGFNGKIFEGEHEEVKKEILPIVPTKTKIKVIVDLPDAVERAAKTQSPYVGLMRLEGIIASSGKHPVKFQKENNLQEYTQILEKGISKIAQHFKEIWIRTSDIRSDEYSQLDGAPELDEANPMLGFHGIRFSLKNPEIFKAELQAIKNVSEKFPDKELGIMIPQVISEDEIKQTQQIIKELEMKVKLGIMVETPAACFIIKYLIKTGIDFISLGTNDLTQYTLAIDRGNEDVQYLYDELHPAMLNAIKRVLRTCKEKNIETSICGQAGSKKEMVKILLESQIDSISVNADAAHEISKLVAELEQNNPQKEINNKPIKNQQNSQENSPEQQIKEIDQKVKTEITHQIQNANEEEKHISKQISQKDNPYQNTPQNSHLPKEKPLPAYVAKTFPTPLQNIKEYFPQDKSEILEIPYDQYENNILQEQIEGSPTEKKNINLSEEDLDEVMKDF